MEMSRSEVLRYLGHKQQKIDAGLNQLIDSCMKEMTEIAKPRYVYEFFEITEVQEAAIVLNESLTLKGKSITNHLKDCSKCVLLAGTLGINVDRQIKQYQLVDMTRALVLDACATAAIEVLCDEAEEEIKKLNLVKGYHTTFRFSPGYGDLPIELQPEVLNQLNAFAKIGLTSTEQCILVPRKSVTACIGLGTQLENNKKKSCRDCDAYEHCGSRREEDPCEFSKGL
ncbi:Vitamin B12 dependent methionine synthase, activation region [Alkaliphilus metalliredigens QYMF]|uniref:Vitamin B12 dependent methionine synthase, activation region n=1 Tax=Alkaliphilus metalliredigens (strain QYMF) TaxID=293826 RepID=A6TTI4_ALKMQ|nr:vitamin B12 dependent-methionine synthase activation domain-containing protein [Alkaliphilus metalliredigens]ABR49502.1 Vitamin B12 dependent methionine synthase, activation region [Alkaliphilus metalliredigens QYMF]